MDIDCESRDLTVMYSQYKQRLNKIWYSLAPTLSDVAKVGSVASEPKGGLDVELGVS
jgi:hypothetical protein